MFNIFLLKSLILALFSSLIFFLYYVIFPGHNDFSFSKVEIFWKYFSMDKNFLFFIWFFLILYIFYKIIFSSKNKEKVTFTPAKIFSLFMIFLLFLSEAYFDFSFFKNFFWNILNVFYWKFSLDLFSDSILFFSKIIFLWIFPVFLFFITTWFWKKISSKLPKIKDFSENTRFLLSLNLWFFSFIFLLTIFSFFWFLNLFVVFWILAIFWIFSYKEIFWFLQWFFTKKFEISKTEGNWIKLLTTEIFYLFAFFVLWTWIISIVRPFPIGWDDLWVYMNYPNILANSSWVWNFPEMYSWQIFTSIWYLLSEPAFAFFLNFSWYFLSFLTLNLIFSEIFCSKKSFLKLNIILSTLFLSLPMSIFHSAKDMKLDQWLFFITTFIVFFLYKLLQKNENWEKISFWYFWIIWILTWFAFSIKFTSLFLIVSILGLLSFFYFWVFGLFWFLFLFFSSFSLANLWWMMNVAISSNLLLNLSFLWFWIIIFWILFFRKNKKFIEFLKIIIIFFIWIFISLLPWSTKNIIETYPNITIFGILNWKIDSPKLDLKNIYSSEEIDEKYRERAKRRLEDPVTTNEDLKRYLWYEEGILPYTNMFWNLTMQVNQWWKFTEISFIFFALIPLIFIFLPFFRNKNFYLVFIIFAFFEVWFFIQLPVEVAKIPENISKNTIEKIFTEKNESFIFKPENISELKNKIEKENIFEKNEILNLWQKNTNFLQKIKDFLSEITLPFGYFIIFLFFIIPFLILNYFLKKSEETFIFRQNLTFSFIYIFLWMISSFWVVWYGITMYFCLLLMIWYWGFYISNYSLKDQNLKYYWSLVFVTIFSAFIIFTSFPHTVSNLTSKAYLDYKTWKTSSLADIFDLHYPYEKIFFELNINNKKEFLEKNVDFEILSNFDLEKIDILQIIDFLKIQIRNWNEKAKRSLENIYKWILYPKSFLNKKNIFRIWTFFKYYVAENQKRIYEDWLLFYFNDFLLDEKNIEKTFENMKKLGFEYILLDLWAATIDDSESHWLTNRYEKLLKTLTAKNLEIIHTDSVCLMFATDLEKINGDKEKFFSLVNGTYESYDENGNKIYRNTKIKKCISEIYNFVNSSNFDSGKFYYLKKYIWKTEDEIVKNFNKWKYIVYKIK